jgi:hypothetical protein
MNALVTCSRLSRKYPPNGKWRVEKNPPGWWSGLDLNRRDPFIAPPLVDLRCSLTLWTETSGKSEASASRPGAIYISDIRHTEGDPPTGLGGSNPVRSSRQSASCASFLRAAENSHRTMQGQSSPFGGPATSRSEGTAHHPIHQARSVR